MTNLVVKPSENDDYATHGTGGANLSSKIEIAKTWDERYGKYGYMWGFDPSPTAVTLASAITNDRPDRSKRIEVIDLGCGYGRDTLFYTDKFGFDAIGIDVSEKAVSMAHEEYQRRQQSGVPITGSAVFLVGNMEDALKTRIGKIDAISSHRTFHLMDDAEVSGFVKQASLRLRSNGLLCLGARSVKDFKPDEMRWIKPGEVAEYTGRKNHKIHFQSEKSMREIFRRDFEDIRFFETTEKETAGEPVETNLIIMLARRKNTAEFIPGGK